MPRKLMDTDAEGVKRRALKLAAHAVAKHADIESKRDAAVRYALDSGASLRETADATGLPHMTVKRIAERAASSS